MKSKQPSPNRRLLGLVVAAACAIVLSGHWQSVNAQTPTNTFPSTGNAGIGTTTPADPLHVTTAAALSEIVRVESTTNSSNVVIGLKDKSPGQLRTFAFDFLNTSGVAIGQIGYANNTTGASQFMNFNTNAAERMRIDGSGNVGIGTTTPGKKLEILATDGEAVRLYRNSNSVNFGVNIKFAFNNSNNAQVDYAGVHGQIASNAAGAEGGNLLFTTISGGTLTEKMRIDSAGNIGIGTS